jgi:ketosteroid isomerase-like protein
MRETDGPQSPAALVARWIDLFNRDVERMTRECYAANAEIEIAGVGLPGREALAATEATVLRAAPDRRAAIETVVVDGEQIAVEGVLTGTEVATGRRFAVPFATFLIVRDGWIVRDRTYFDRLAWPSTRAALTPPA